MVTGEQGGRCHAGPAERASRPEGRGGERRGMLLPQAAAAAVARRLPLGLAGRAGRLPVGALLPLVPAAGPGLLGGAGAGAQRGRQLRLQQRQRRVLALAQEHGQEGPRATLGKETEERPGEGRRCRKFSFSGKSETGPEVVQPSSRNFVCVIRPVVPSIPVSVLLRVDGACLISPKKLLVCCLLFHATSVFARHSLLRSL